MKNETKLSTRDEVLYAFFLAHEKPTLSDIEKWVGAYPDFAEDIRDHATVALDDATGLNDPDGLEPNDADYARGHSNAMNAIFKASRSESMKSPESSVSPRNLEELVKNSGLTVPEIARSMSVHRSVVADFVGGRMRVPAGRKFVMRFGEIIQLSVDDIDSAHRATLGRPTLLVAKASRTPTKIVRSYDDIIRSSGMTPEEVAFWLSDD